MSTSSAMLIQRMRRYGASTALIWKDQTWSYDALLERSEWWFRELWSQGFRAGDRIAIAGDYSPNTAALLLALIAGGQIAVPLTTTNAAQLEEAYEIACVQAVCEFSDSDEWRLVRRSGEIAPHPLFSRLEEAGLIVFTTGTSGASKAVLHDFARLLRKFETPRPKLRGLVFLLLDHLGGINTLLHILANGGTAVTIPERSSAAVAQAIARHRVQLLPTSPTFINMLLMSGVAAEVDLSSLEVITFGTEPMPESLLRKLRQRFPKAVCKQTYGLTEVGVLQTHSRADDSLWLELSSDSVEWCVRDGMLWLRSPVAMLGYLNADDPFDAEGWFNTRDEVEVDGKYIKILGRRSDTINVGGNKVFPAIVENILLQASNVDDVQVYGRKSAVLGQVVAARLTLLSPEAPDALLQRLRTFCQGRLAPHEIPLFIEVREGPNHTARYKKQRAH